MNIRAFQYYLRLFGEREINGKICIVKIVLFIFFNDGIILNDLSPNASKRFLWSLFGVHGN